MADGGDAATRIAQAGGGIVSIRGRVADLSYRTEKGFTLGEIRLTDDTSGMTIVVKNENLACFLDDAVHATVPDLICLFDGETGVPVANPDVSPGQSISVVVLPAPRAFTSQVGLSVFGPRYAGINAEFVTQLQAAEWARPRPCLDRRGSRRTGCVWPKDLPSLQPLPMLNAMIEMH